MSSERLDQLSGGYAALRTARARFGLGAEADACVLLFSDREEWLVGCGDSVDGFTETGQHFTSPDGRVMPVLWQEGALIMGETHMPYAQIGTQLVGTVATWSRDEGGSAPVLLLQDWQTLNGNHPAFQEESVGAWFGVFVHEGFHAHQLSHPTVNRVVSALVARDALVPKESFAALYDQSEALRDAVQREYAILHEAALREDLSPADAKAALARWLVQWDQRWLTHQALFAEAFPGGDASNSEALAIFIEGTARYVEMRFVTEPPPALEARFGEQAFAFRGRPPTEVRGLSGIGSKYVYALGMYLCVLLDVAEPTWQGRLFEEEALLVGLVREVVANTTANSRTLDSAETTP